TWVPTCALPGGSLQRFETEAKKAISELAELAETHDVTVFCENEGERKRFRELVELERQGLCEKLHVPVGYLHRGCVWNVGATPASPSDVGVTPALPKGEAGLAPTRD